MHHSESYLIQDKQNKTICYKNELVTKMYLPRIKWKFIHFRTRARIQLINLLSQLKPPHIQTNTPHNQTKWNTQRLQSKFLSKKEKQNIDDEK